MATELTPDLWRLHLRGVNAYLVDDDAVTLVDAGTPWDTATIRTELAEAGVAVRDIDRVLLTHYDLDHVGTLASLAPTLEATVYGGRFDLELLTGRRAPPWRNRKGALQRAAGLLLDRPSLECKALPDGVSIGSFTAFHTPGHTPGHIAYVSEALEVALLGDLVQVSNGELEASGWLVSYDLPSVRESIARLAAEAPAFEIACAGHGEPLLTNGDDALETVADRQ